MWTEGGAKKVVGPIYVIHPVANDFVDRVLQGTASGVDRSHNRTEKAHPIDIRRLAHDVVAPHVDNALQVEQRRGAALSTEPE